MATIRLRVGDQSFVDGDFPLPVGGPKASAPLSLNGDRGADPGPLQAWLALDQDELFIQPAAGQWLVVDGRRSEESHWIEAGDVVGVGSHRLSFRALSQDSEPGLELWVESFDEANRTLPPEELPVLKPPARSPSPRSSVNEPKSVKAVDFQPARSVSQSSGGKWRAGRIVAPIFLLLLLIATVGLFTARSVSITVEPAADRLTLAAEGPLPLGPVLGERRLLWPGSYRLRAEKAGYRALDQELVVGSEARQDLRFELQELPSVLTIEALWQGQQPDGVSYWLDEQSLSSTVVERPKGSYQLRLEHPRFRPVERRVEFAGFGEEHREVVELEPLWADVEVVSKPPARLSVDGEPLGETPVTVQLMAGERRYELVRVGFRPLRGKIEVNAGQARSVGPLELQPSNGNLAIVTSPTGAEIVVDGRYRGRSPLDLSLTPGVDHRIQARKQGWQSAETEVRIRAAGSEEVTLELSRVFGRVTFEVFPPDAELIANGEPVSLGEGNAASLWAVPQAVEVRRAGYVSQRFDITPSPDQGRHIQAHLKSEAVVREQKIQARLQTVEGQRLILVEPGRLRMGASRREAGRRANETLRDVQLTHRFYASVNEVTNVEFRRFNATHRSGLAGGESLDLDDHPVVQVTWQQAVAYCNWLSEKEGLPAFYVRSGDDWVPAQPINEGFRLPSEAEWSWIARYDADGQGPRKYPWGGSLPPTEGAGNFADQSAQSVIEGTLQNYRDGFAATAPVTAFSADSRGFHQLGGNAAEWVHDAYQARPATVGAVERNPLGPPKGEMHVIRGSSWMHSTISELRLSYRDYGKDARPDVGFRIARYVDGEVP